MFSFVDPFVNVVFVPVTDGTNGNPAAPGKQHTGRDRLRYCLHPSFEASQEIDSSPERYSKDEWKGFLGR